MTDSLINLTTFPGGVVVSSLQNCCIGVANNAPILVQLVKWSSCLCSQDALNVSDIPFND